MKITQGIESDCLHIISLEIDSMTNEAEDVTTSFFTTQCSALSSKLVLFLTYHDARLLQKMLTDSLGGQ